jgi:hypothetical protein
MSARPPRSTIDTSLPVVSLPAVSITVQPIALNVQDAARVCGLASWTIREGILTGAIKAKKAGRSHVILLTELHRWLDDLDEVAPSSAPSILQRKSEREARRA